MTRLQQLPLPYGANEYIKHFIHFILTKIRHLVLTPSCSESTDIIVDYMLILARRHYLWMICVSNYMPCGEGWLSAWKPCMLVRAQQTLVCMFAPVCHPKYWIRACDVGPHSSRTQQCWWPCYGSLHFLFQIGTAWDFQTIVEAVRVSFVSFFLLSYQPCFEVHRIFYNRTTWWSIIELFLCSST